MKTETKLKFGTYTADGELSAAFASEAGFHLRTRGHLQGGSVRPIELDDEEDDSDDSDPEKEARYLEAARRLHQKDGVLEIDDDAIVSMGSDPGAYVAAWVWVSNEDLKS
jgi:hypothetical protein